MVVVIFGMGLGGWGKVQFRDGFFGFGFGYKRFLVFLGFSSFFGRTSMRTPLLLVTNHRKVILDSIEFIFFYCSNLFFQC